MQRSHRSVSSPRAGGRQRCRCAEPCRRPMERALGPEGMPLRHFGRECGRRRRRCSERSLAHRSAQAWPQTVERPWCRAGPAPHGESARLRGEAPPTLQQRVCSAETPLLREEPCTSFHTGMATEGDALSLWCAKRRPAQPSLWQADTARQETVGDGVSRGWAPHAGQERERSETGSPGAGPRAQAMRGRASQIG